MGPTNEKLVFNSVLNFRRLTHFWLCLLEININYKRLAKFVCPSVILEALGMGARTQNSAGQYVTCDA